MVIDVKLVKIGNSLSFRVPKFAVNKLHLSEGSISELEIEEDKLIFRPKHRYDLKNLLKEITPQTLHTETHTENELGNECIE